MYTAFITTGVVSGAARVRLLDEPFAISAISRTPTIVSLLRGGVLPSKTTHVPIMHEEQHLKIAVEQKGCIIHLFIH